MTTNSTNADADAEAAATAADNAAQAQDIGSSGQYASDRRKLIELIDRIKSHGAEADIDTPMLAVIGNQSSGKSSLLEGIAKINLPRSAGTCTRVPMEIRLTRDKAPWSCKMSLRIGDDATSANGDIPSGFKNMAFGPKLANAKDVEKLIIAAQGVLLNPARYKTALSASAFHSDSGLEEFLRKLGPPAPAVPKADLAVESTGDQTPVEETKNEKGFSRDVICVHISSPELTDLTLIDLPGIISNAPKDHEGDIKLIESMVREYIRKENCIILLKLTMKDEIQNQAACRLARDFDGSGERTLGVLTKPDTVEKGDHVKWVGLVNGRDEENGLHHGYYVVKQRTTEQLAEDIDSRTMRGLERQFFSSTKPWADLQLEHPTRFGTDNLVQRLNELLSSHIQTKLPSIVEKVSTLLKKTEQEHAALPVIWSDKPIYQVNRACQQLGKNLSECARTSNYSSSGTASASDLVRLRNRMADWFGDKIRKTRPIYTPASTDDEDGDEEDAADDPVPVKPARMNLAEVRDLLAQFRDRGTIYDVDPRVRRIMTQQATQLWRSITEATLAAVYPSVQENVLAHVEIAFGRFVRSGLLDRVKAIVLEELERLNADTTRRANDLISIETGEFPWTQNAHYLAASREKYLDSLHAQYQLRNVKRSAPEKRDNPKGGTPGSNDPGSAANAPAAVSSGSPAPAKDAPNAPAGANEGQTAAAGKRTVTEYDAELALMAEVRAYWKCASKRFIDYLPLTIDDALLLPLGEKIEHALTHGLPMEDPPAMHRLVTEDPAAATRRNIVENKLKRLKDIDTELRAFQGPSSAERGASTAAKRAHSVIDTHSANTEQRKKKKKAKV